jgi:hypothetical protein
MYNDQLNLCIQNIIKLEDQLLKLSFRKDLPDFVYDRVEQHLELVKSQKKDIIKMNNLIEQNDKSDEIFQCSARIKALAEMINKDCLDIINTIRNPENIKEGETYEN